MSSIALGVWVEFWALHQAVQRDPNPPKLDVTKKKR
jgi:hypothetical protein